MQPANTRHFIYSFLVLAIALLLLLIIQQFVKLPHTKSFDFFADIKEKSSYSERTTKSSDLVKIFSDSSLFEKGLVNEKSIIDYGSTTFTQLTYFFEALKNIHTTKKVRIAYFGDSMIEGDLITQDLRKFFQKKYGGNGVGLVPLTSNTAGFRKSISHTFSTNWAVQSLLDKVQSNNPLGIMGYSFSPYQNSDTANQSSTNSWVSYVASDQTKDEFNTVKLLYGKATGNNYIYYSNGSKSISQQLKGGNMVNEMLLFENCASKMVKASFSSTNSLPIYAINFDSDSGVFVDNFSFRGNSGMPLTKIPISVLKGINDYLDYDLIVLHYGLNVANSTVTNFGWYENGLNQVLAHFRSAFPHTSILMISVNDKSYKENGVYVTDPSIPLIVETQHRVAQKNKVAFWNLYQAMGGYNSMVNWVEGDTALANKDYTHVNFKGAKKIATMLYNELENRKNETK